MRCDWVLVLALLAIACAAEERSAQDFADRYWPPFPKPVRVVPSESMNEIPFERAVVLQTLAGLVARHARRTGGGEYVWIGLTRNPSYDEWLQRCLRYNSAELEAKTHDTWSLVERYRHRGGVKGYILYRKDGSDRRLYEGTPENTSINVATSLCGALGGVAVEESLRGEADRRGLSCLADVRDRGELWPVREFVRPLSPRLLGLQDPKSFVARETMVAMDALVIHGVGRNYDLALSRTRPGSPVLGWGIGDERAVTMPSTRHALMQTSTNWCANLPVLSAGKTGLDYPFKQFASPQESNRSDSPDTRYVTFVMSDGDNVQWLMLNFCKGPQARQYWGCRERGANPLGWTVPSADLMQLCPYTLDHIRETATPNDDFILLGGGYYYPDSFGEGLPPGNWLERHAGRIAKYMRQTGTRILLVNAQDWDSPNAVAAYRTYARAIPELRGIFVIQYAPYTAGRGRVIWVSGADGAPVPVVSAKWAIWAGRGQHPSEGTPNRIADWIVQWASREPQSVEDRFAWVIVHCWSWFKRCPTDTSFASEEVDQGRSSGDANVARGYMPALWSAKNAVALAKARGVNLRVVTPSCLLKMLRACK